MRYPAGLSLFFDPLNRIIIYFLPPESQEKIQEKYRINRGAPIACGDYSPAIPDAQDRKLSPQGRF
jgi:hypothetical protein